MSKISVFHDQPLDWFICPIPWQSSRRHAWSPTTMCREMFPARSRLGKVSLGLLNYFPTGLGRAYFASGRGDRGKGRFGILNDRGVGADTSARDERSLCVYALLKSTAWEARSVSLSRKAAVCLLALGSTVSRKNTGLRESGSSCTAAILVRPEAGRHGRAGPRAKGHDASLLWRSALPRTVP